LITKPSYQVFKVSEKFRTLGKSSQLSCEADGEGMERGRKFKVEHWSETTVVGSAKRRRSTKEQAKESCHGP
jgi:hypothetical protein